MLEELGRCAQLCGELNEAGRAWEEVADGLHEAVDQQRLAEVQRQLATVYELQGTSPKAVAARLEAADGFDAVGLHGDAAVELSPHPKACGARIIRPLERSSTGARGRAARRAPELESVA